MPITKNGKPRGMPRATISFSALGNAASLGGNSACHLTEVEELTKTIRGKMTVRSFAGLPAITFPIEFTYHTEHLSSALKANSAITYRFYRENKKWHVYATLDRVEVPIVTDRANGFLGADMNAGHLACAGINKDGNLTSVFDLDLKFEAGESSNRRKDRIQKVVIKLVEKASVAGTPIVIEKLDFSKKKKELKSRGYNRMISSFAYSSFNTQLHSRAQKQGVEVIEVTPAYSSHIGYYKFAKGMGLPIHQGAALAIARRGGTTFTKHISFKEDPKGKHIYIPHARFSERLRVYPSRSTLPRLQGCVGVMSGRIGGKFLLSQSVQEILPLHWVRRGEARNRPLMRGIQYWMLSHTWMPELRPIWEQSIISERIRPQIGQVVGPIGTLLQCGLSSIKK